MTDRVFLTDKRRAVLEGEADELADATIRNHKSRIRTRARIALEELTEVAMSDEIDNDDIFTPQQLDTLLRAILGDLEEIEPLYEMETQDEEYEHQQTYRYEKLLTRTLQNTLEDYETPLWQLFPPDENRASGSPGLEMPGVSENQDED